MKFFDALKRKKTYIEGTGVKVHDFYIKGADYSSLEVDEQIPYIEALFGEELDFSDYFANHINIHIKEIGNEEEILSENELFNLISNIATVYAKRFPVQQEKVLMPKKAVLETLPVSPMTVVLLTNKHIVNKPLQITISLSHPETGGSYEVSLV